VTTLVAAPTIRMRLLNPFDVGDRTAFTTLRESAGGPAAVPPRWDFLVATLGAWNDDGGLTGYVQFGTGVGMTFEYGLRLDLRYRGFGLGKRLVAEWLRVARAAGALVAMSSALPTNRVMRALLDSARFEVYDTIATTVGVEDVYLGGDPSFEWAEAQPREEWA